MGREEEEEEKGRSLSVDADSETKENVSCSCLILNPTVPHYSSNYFCSPPIIEGNTVRLDDSICSLFICSVVGTLEFEKQLFI